MVFDADIVCDGPVWDFDVNFQGARYVVRLPTAEELSRIHDMAGIGNEQMYSAMLDLFSMLTGIDRARAATIDYEKLVAFFNDVACYFGARWDAYHRSRNAQRVVNDRLLPNSFLARGSG